MQITEFVEFSAGQLEEAFREYLELRAKYAEIQGRIKASEATQRALGRAAARSKQKWGRIYGRRARTRPNSWARTT